MLQSLTHISAKLLLLPIAVKQVIICFLLTFYCSEPPVSSLQSKEATEKANEQSVGTCENHVSESHCAYIWGGGNLIFKHSSLHNLALSGSKRDIRGRLTQLLHSFSHRSIHKSTKPWHLQASYHLL